MVIYFIIKEFPLNNAINSVEHMTVHDSVPRHKSMMELDTVTRYDATLPEANIDLPIDEKNPRQC